LFAGTRSRKPPIAIADELGFAFRRPELVLQALTHRSFGAGHNERLEFIGDAVLNCVIAEALFERFPAIPEGELSRVRASLVNRDTLARVARRLSLSGEILLGEGELKSGGAERPSILANALEAIFGAVFVDGGYDAARAAILRVYSPEWVDLDPTALSKDPKTRLQEWLQAPHPGPGIRGDGRFRRSSRADVHDRVPDTGARHRRHRHRTEPPRRRAGSGRRSVCGGDRPVRRETRWLTARTAVSAAASLRSWAGRTSANRRSSTASSARE
jgi:ribonuclease-3